MNLQSTIGFSFLLSRIRNIATWYILLHSWLVSLFAWMVACAVLKPNTALLLVDWYPHSLSLNFPFLAAATMIRLAPSTLLWWLATRHANNCVTIAVSMMSLRRLRPQNFTLPEEDVDSFGILALLILSCVYPPLLAMLLLDDALQPIAQHLRDFALLFADCSLEA